MRSLIYLLLQISNTVHFQTPVVSFSKNNLFETITFKSEILNENRILNIYLPNEYFNDSTQKFPVIYLLDGSLDEDFIHIAGLVQFCSFSWINEIEPTIVVGIENVDRQ